MYAPSDGISPPGHAPGQLREPEWPVAVRHHRFGTAPGGLGRRDPGALRAGVPHLRGGAHIAARAVAALPPILCAARRDGRTGAAAFRCSGLRLCRAGERPSGGRSPGRLLALYAGYHRAAQRHRPQQPVGGGAGPHRPRHTGAGQADLAARRDVLPGTERHLADRLAGARAGKLHPVSHRYAGLRCPHRDCESAYLCTRRRGEPVGGGARRGRDHCRGLGQR